MLKKYPAVFTISLVVMLMFGSVPSLLLPSGNVVLADASDFSGGGTKSDPYQIANAEDLDNMRKHLDAGKYFILAENIDLADYLIGRAEGWIPIGTNSDRFQGHFNGNGHEIRNLRIADDTLNNAGLFGGISGSSTITNVRLIAVDIVAGDHTGSLVGTSVGGIHNSYATGEIKGINIVGGLVGINGGTIYNSQADIAVTGEDKVGGLVGTSTGQIHKSFAIGDVTGTLNVGGLTGLTNSTKSIGDSYARGNVTGESQIGGFAGTVNNTGNGVIYNNHATGLVTGIANDIGGLTGNYANGAPPNMKHNFFDSETTKQSDVNASGLSTSDMKSSTKFVNAGWDFDKVWAITSEINNGYPYLRTYTLTYNGDGNDSGTAPTDSIQYAHGSTASLAGKPLDLEKEGHTFMGWNKQTDGTGSDDYGANDHFTMTGDATLYATWLSNDSKLSDLTIDKGTLLAAFLPSQLSYNVEMELDQASLQLTLTEADPLQNITVTSSDVDVQDLGSNIYDISNVKTGTRTVQIEVSSPDGTATTNYELTIIRKPVLASLMLSSGQLNVPFDAGITDYRAQVSSASSSLIVTASTYDPDATLTVNSVTVLNHHASDNIALIVGDNLPIHIEVTSSDGTMKTDYYLTVNRARSTPASVSCSNDASIDGQLSYSSECESEVRLGNTLSIYIPSGATNQSVEIWIEEVLSHEGLLPNQEILASAIYELSKSISDHFLKPVTVTFTFDPKLLNSGHTVGIFYFDEENKAWTKIEGAQIMDGQISVELEHFSKYAVLVIDKETGHPIVDKQTGDPVSDIHFSDIADHWAEESIKQALRRGMVQGYSDGTFRPDHNITRAEFAVLLMRIVDSQKSESSLSFADTAEIGGWAKEAISKAIQEGIIEGYPDNTFRPKATINRAEMAVMTARALSAADRSISSTSFSDDQDIPHWAKAAVEYLKQQNIIVGRGENRFAPQAVATRAEVVTILLNLGE